jgi:hypothetical protein
LTAVLSSECKKKRRCSRESKETNGWLGMMLTVDNDDDNNDDEQRSDEGGEGRRMTVSGDEEEGVKLGTEP